MTGERLGWRFRCPAERSVHCDRGESKPGRSKCSCCGSTLVVERGRWGVFVWTGTGRYPAGAELASSHSPTLAQRLAEKQPGDPPGGHVVRFIPSG